MLPIDKMCTKRTPERVFIAMNSFNVCMNVVLNALISQIDLPTYMRACLRRLVALKAHKMIIMYTHTHRALVCALEYLSSVGDFT